MDTGPESLALIADLALRGGAVGITLLIAGLLLSIRPLCAVSFLGAGFTIGAAIYAVVMIEPVQSALGPAFIVLKFFAMLSPAFFWLFIRALFDDDFTFEWWMAGPFAVIGTLYVVCIPFPALEQISKTIHLAIVLALMVHVLRMTRSNLRDDLVASRRQFTGLVAVLVPLVCVAIGVIEAYEFLEMRSNIGSLSIAAMLFVVSSAFASGIAGIHKSLLPRAAAGAPQPNGGSTSAADRLDLMRLDKLMAEGVYLHPGLTIGELAARMDMPEHRLRRLINKGLGYRNFAAFINDHRIEEATRRLSAPQTAREQITSLAFDLGYSSLAPFNRAFRERIGMSPSQYREKALEGV